MINKYVRITDKAKEELAKAKIIGNRLEFDGVLKNYSEIKKVFDYIGVNWSKKEKIHFVSENTAERIAEIVGGGKIVDEKKTRSAFYTPVELAKRVVKMAEIKGLDKVLEPSAGSGRLVAEIMKYTNNIEIVEIDADTFQECIKSYNCRGWNMDFLDFTNVATNSYDKIIMNSPYDRDIWTKHLAHAWKFLKSGGKMVAICPNNESNKKYQEFIEGKRHKVTPVDAGAFKESGTNIATMIVEIWK